MSCRVRRHKSREFENALWRKHFCRSAQVALRDTLVLGTKDYPVGSVEDRRHARASKASRRTDIGDRRRRTEWRLRSIRKGSGAWQGRLLRRTNDVLKHPIEHRAQRVRLHRLVQHMVTTGVRLATMLRCGVAGDEECRGLE